MQGTVTDYPETLAVICALRVDYNFFYQDLLEDYSLIESFIKSFFFSSENFAIPERSKRILSRYQKPNKEEQEQPVTELKDEYIPLAQYLRYIQGVRLPAYLQPLLLMSQDSSGRKIGNNRAIYEALINADSNAVLQDLNHGREPVTFKAEVMGAFNDILEDLQNDSEVIVSNAAVALGELAPRFPKHNHHSVVSFLTNCLTRYPNVRFRIGIKNIKIILELATRDEQTRILQTLSEELIKEDEPITFKKTSGDSPSFEELSQLVTETVYITLEYGYANKIRIIDEQRILNWLSTRKYSNKTQEDFIPFQTYEGWIDNFPDLRNKVGLNYVSEAIDVLSSEGNVNIQLVIDTLQDAVRAEWQNGEETRDKLTSLKVEIPQSLMT